MNRDGVTWHDVVSNCEDFDNNVGAGEYYEWALWVVEEAWGSGRKSEFDSKGVVAGIMILEYSWNAMFYDKGVFQYKEVEEALRKYRESIDRFRGRDMKLTARDEGLVRLIFKDFLRALRNGSNVRSPVAVAKCLHLLAPQFFPLWDNPIAKATGCHWGSPVDPDRAAECYIRFMKHIFNLVKEVESDYIRQKRLSPKAVRQAMERELIGQSRNGKTILKIMDEYLYVQYTRDDWKKG